MNLLIKINFSIYSEKIRHPKTKTTGKIKHNSYKSKEEEEKENYRVAISDNRCIQKYLYKVVRERAEINIRGNNIITEKFK